jgi:RimJ/RimL family protein N-acetyltransferase
LALHLPFSQHEPITTERLVLRPFEVHDRVDLARVQRTPGVADYLYWEVPDDEELDRRLDDKIAATQLHHVDDRLALAGISEEHGFVADASLDLIDVENATLEIGYIVDPRFAGQGYGTEVARALVALAIDDIGAHRVIGRIDARNHASRRVLERAGMRLEAHFVDNEYVKGEWTSEMVFALLAREYQQGRRGA